MEYPEKRRTSYASRIAEKLAAKKAAIYIRVSTHWQVDKDSLKVQRRELIAYVTLVLGITGLRRV